MSDYCNTDCPTDPCDNPPTGKKISELPNGVLDTNDLFVIVDVSEQTTSQIKYSDVVYFDSSGTTLSADNFGDAINEVNDKIDSISGMSGYHNDLQGLQGGTSGEYYHLTEDEYDVVVSISNGDGLVPPGGDPDQVLVKNTSGDYDYSWADDTGAGIPDVSATGTYIRETGNWIPFNPDNKEDYLGSGSDGQVLATSAGDVRYWIDMNTDGFGDAPSGDTYLRTSGMWIQSDPFDSDNYYTSGVIDNMISEFAYTSAVNELSATVEYNTSNIYTISGSLEQHISATNNPHQTSYLNLTDTDNVSYTGFGGYKVIVNLDEDGLVFARDDNTDNIAAAPYIYRTYTGSIISPTMGEVRPNSNTHDDITTLLISNKDSKGFDKTDGLSAITKDDFLSISTQTAFSNFKVITSNDMGNYHEFGVTPLSTYGTFTDKNDIQLELLFRGVSDFDSLTDTPSSKVGHAGQIVAVDSHESSLEYIDIPDSGISDVTTSGTFLRTSGSWLPSDEFNSNDYYTNIEVDNILNNYATSADLANKEDYLGTGIAGQVLATSGTDTRYWTTIQSSTPDLQAVTDEGHTTTNPIEVGTPAKNTTISNGAGVGAVGIVMNDNSKSATILFNEPDNSIEINHKFRGGSYIVPIIDEEYVQKKYIDDSIAGHKSIRTADFVYAGGVNSGVILEIHSAFNDKSGLPIPSTDYEVDVVGVRVAASSSYNNNNPDGVKLQLSEMDKDSSIPFDFGVGDSKYYVADIFNGISQSGMKYNFLFNIPDNVSYPFPIRLTPDKILFCEFYPNNWTFTDLKVTVIYTINKVV